MEIKEVLIIGSGFSGLCMAIKLKKAGIHNFKIIEKEKEIGGTWYVNTYPAAACDVESHLYSFSFEPKHDWTRTYPQQQEILEYMKFCADKYKIREHIQFNTTVTSAVFDEKENVWEITTDKNEKIKAKYFITGVGPLSDPLYPKIKGLEEFEGVTFHSARWNHEYDLAGKKVAVLGSGASAIQFVPEIAKQVKALFLFQRTPPWVFPKGDRPFEDKELKRFKYIPGYRLYYREKIYWTYEKMAVGFVQKPELLQHASQSIERYIKKSIKDLELQKKLIPNYTLGCKRILYANNWYPTLNKENVNVISEAIERVNKHSISTNDGNEYAVDAIIYATGFKATEHLSNIHIVGRQGRVFEELRKKDGDAYLGTSTYGFPNMFMLVGPNTGVGHTSIIHIIESQVKYIIDALNYVRRNKIKSFEVKEEVLKAYNVELSKKMEGTVWHTGGCKSWYIDENGKIPTVYPDFTYKFRKATKKFYPEKYILNA
jgi:cation diffusion facilitator CzcD-associated flavoprotein CzcO